MFDLDAVDDPAQGYAGRGEGENRNEQFKCGLAKDRLSGHRFMANCFRPYLHATAMNLLVRLRRFRPELYGDVHTARRQLNLPPVSNDVKSKSKRASALVDIEDDCVRRRVEADRPLLGPMEIPFRPATPLYRP
jgi:hypothetical protein